MLRVSITGGTAEGALVASGQPSGVSMPLSQASSLHHSPEMQVLGRMWRPGRGQTVDLDANSGVWRDLGYSPTVIRLLSLVCGGNVT
jgi:hypothetical protein